MGKSLGKSVLQCTSFCTGVTWRFPLLLLQRFKVGFKRSHFQEDEEEEKKKKNPHVIHLCELQQRNLVPWFFFGAWVSVWVHCSSSSTVHSTGGWRLEPPMAGQKHSLMTLSRQLNGHNSAAAAMLLISHVLRTTNRSVIYVRPIPSFPPWSQKSQDEKSFKSCLSILVEVSAVCKSKTGHTFTRVSSPCKNFDYSRLYLTISRLWVWRAIQLLNISNPFKDEKSCHSWLWFSVHISVFSKSERR